MSARDLVDRFHETNRIGRMELKPTPPHAEERRSAIHRAQAFQFARAATRLEAWPLARSRLWPSFETRARARSSGRGRLRRRYDSNLGNAVLGCVKTPKTRKREE
jgi:hypothetical protein